MGIGKDLFGNRTWQCQDINWEHAECVQEENKCKGYRLKKGETLTCEKCNHSWHRLKDL